MHPCLNQAGAQHSLSPMNAEDGAVMGIDCMSDTAPTVQKCTQLKIGRCISERVTSPPVPAGRVFACRLNKFGEDELSAMPKTKPSIGPMRTQPAARASTMTTPMMAAAGRATKAPERKQEPTTTEATRAAKARITRLNSLRKQREALKAASGS